MRSPSTRVQPSRQVLNSRRLIVGSDTDEASERSRCSHRKSARAARISSTTERKGRPSHLVPEALFNTLSIDNLTPRDTIPEVSIPRGKESCRLILREQRRPPIDERS